MRTLTFSIAFSLIAFSTPLYAKGNGSSAGISLLDPTGARPAALGEAFTAASDDITAFEYNPASLDTLTKGQASFLYNKGLSDDAFGQVSIGAPTKVGALGFSVGYYNGGNIELFDGTNSKTVTAKTDLLASLGMAKTFGRMSVGVSAKYISSELIEQAKASAFAGDIGLQMNVGQHASVGAALQNFGTQMKFVSESSDLPRIARVGLSSQLFTSHVPMTLFVDAPYHFNENQLRPGLGLEFPVGPLALRAGYKLKNDQQQISFGAGFLMGAMSLDYSYGMVSDLDASHRVSLSLRFGSESSAPQIISQKPQENVTASSRAEVTFLQRSSLANQQKGLEASRSGEVYIVKAGDSLGRIAQSMYGDSSQWKKIYVANKHLLNDGKTLEAGQRIVLP